MKSPFGSLFTVIQKSMCHI